MAGHRARLRRVVWGRRGVCRGWSRGHLERGRSSSRRFRLKLLVRLQGLSLPPRDVIRTFRAGKDEVTSALGH